MTRFAYLIIISLLSLYVGRRKDALEHEQYLEQLYGNYMIPPDEKNRKSLHRG